jgi:hypothetical protein
LGHHQRLFYQQTDYSSRSFPSKFFFPVAIKILLVIGGVYLAYEGVEKIIEFLHRKKPVEK